MDESGDISHKKQMRVVFHYVDKIGIVKERFIGVVHVKDTSSSSLKVGIDLLFSEYSLTFQDSGLKVMMEQITCKVSSRDLKP